MLRTIPDRQAAQSGLGRAYKAAGDLEKARTAFQRALEIDPAFKKANDGLNALRWRPQIQLV